MLVSIIIPTLNEAETIKGTLTSTIALPGEKEILVADGGSKDGTMEIASRLTKVISAPRGRALQMNAAAAEARGEALLFLHSDTRLPPNALGEVENIISQPGVVGGAFSLRIDSPAISFRLIEKGSIARARILKIFFGDQAIFCRRDVFFKVGGYPPIPLMEDWELSRELKQAGQMRLLKSRVITSARRWELHGTWNTVLLMHKLKLLYLLGISPDRLLHLYDDSR